MTTLAAPALSVLKLPAVLASHMVVQRDVPIGIWGSDKPGQKVTVSMNQASVTGTSGADGTWKVKLPALPAGGPYTITIQGSGTIELTDILVGDVWICSGQSNMEWLLRDTHDAKRTIPAARHPMMRLFTVIKEAASEPQADCHGNWSVCTPETAEAFSAVGYHFGRELQQALNIPIGLINTSWGGTKAEVWTSREALKAEPKLAYLAADEDPMGRVQGLLAEHQKRIPEPLELNLKLRQDGSCEDPGRRAFTTGWEKPEFDDSCWPEMEVPRMWEHTGLTIDGAVWFRRVIDIPAAWAGRELLLSLGALDDFDTTFFNGQQVGATGMDTPNWWQHRRQYRVPANLVKAGKAVIATRIFDQYINGGFAGPANAMFLASADDLANPIDLTGTWRHQVECCRIAMDAANTGASLFNVMINPLLNAAIKGAIWYQGESNADRPTEYQTLLPAMITDWRNRWGVGGFPFYIVQLANFQASGPQPAQPADSQWAELREAQSLTAQRVPDCGIAIAIDIGEALDIHPRNKRDVGRRLALQALKKTYGRKVTAESPTFASMRSEGGRLRLRFNTDGAKLVSTDGKPLRGFAVAARAGADRRFVWAKAEITGPDEVSVWAEGVNDPKCVQYAWADDPSCNLGSDAGLPASPFRANL